MSIHQDHDCCNPFDPRINIARIPSVRPVAFRRHPQQPVRPSAPSLTIHAARDTGRFVSVPMIPRDRMSHGLPSATSCCPWSTRTRVVVSMSGPRWYSGNSSSPISPQGPCTSLARDKTSHCPSERDIYPARSKIHFVLVTEYQALRAMTHRTSETTQNRREDHSALTQLVALLSNDNHRVSRDFETADHHKQTRRIHGCCVIAD